MTPFVLAPPLILAGVLLIGAIAKLRTPDSADAWIELGVPAVFRRRWLQQLHPWGEVLLAVLLVAAGGVLGALVAAAAVLLFGAYLVLIARSHRQHPGASCNCFGARAPITGRTVVRNVWYVVLALATAGVTWTTPILGGPLAALGADGGWLVALIAVAVTVWLSMPDAASDPLPALATPIVGDPDEYIRVRTPAVPVTTGDGEVRNLRDLSLRQPLLLLAVSEGCGSCLPVIEAIQSWRALLPEVSVRFLLLTEPGESALTETSEPQSLHDPNQYVRGSIDDWPTPTGVLIGADGYLAGGPVSGYDAIADFIGDIYETLHGERPPSS
ncbi:MauE/DoxX family redox-associated membrane protein [Microbacterium profundi]